jgi:hypothetical protein
MKEQKQLKLDLGAPPARVPLGPMSPVEKARLELREQFREKLDNGSNCPCCGRWAKRYRRHVNATMAGALCTMVALQRAGEGEWLRAEKIGQTLRANMHFAAVSYPHGEIGKLAFLPWGLVEARPHEQGKKKHSGQWRATARGEAFVEGKLGIPRYLWVYDNHVDAQSEEQMFIHQAFKQSFNYQELLKRSAL